jgi:hypothetical protein
VGFPLPEPLNLFSNDVVRDEIKRAKSPPSSFYAQSQAIYLAVRYFEDLHSGYKAAAEKHMNRIRSALFAQLMANFEFAVKDFIAQVLDATHIYDTKVASWSWVNVNVPAVLSTRGGDGRIGAVLIHPLLGWQDPDDINKRYRDVFGAPLVWPAEEQPLRDLWIVRHAVAHNGGFMTSPDARRLRSSPLAEKQVLIDLNYLDGAIWFLRGIIVKLHTEIGPKVLKHWFKEAASRDWAQDEAFYTRIKLVTVYVESRIKDLPSVEASMYEADLASYG